MSVDDDPGPVPGRAAPVALAVTAAGVVTQVIGFVVRAARTTGAWHEAGGSLVAVGLAVAVIGVAAQLAPAGVRVAVGAPRVAGAVAVVAVGVVAATGIVVGSRLASGPVGVAGPGPTTVLPPAGPLERSGRATDAPGSIGAALAAQGLGSNSPPPSVEGVDFPGGDGDRHATTAAPWGAPSAMPVTVPPRTGTEAATDAGAVPSTSVVGGGS